MGWMIDYKGATLREEEVAFAHVAIVNELLGREDTWATIDPISSPKALATWVALAVSIRTGQGFAEVLTYVQSRPLTEIIAAYTPDTDSVIVPKAPESTPGAARSDERPPPPPPEPVRPNGGYEDPTETQVGRSKVRLGPGARPVDRERWIQTLARQARGDGD